MPGTTPESSTMTVQSDFTVASAPEITPGAVSDIITKLAPFTFESGMNITMCAKFPEFLEKVTFSLEFTDAAQDATDAHPFLAAVRTNQDLLASRLADTRVDARATLAETVVSMDGIVLDPTWPRLVLSAGPYDTTEDEDDNA
jgi:hypothetical protein